MQKLLTIITILMVTTVLNAQQFPDNSLGQLKKFSASGNTFTFETTNGTARLMVYSPEVLRLRIAKGKPADDFSYAVVAKPQLAMKRRSFQDTLIQ